MWQFLFLHLPGSSSVFLPFPPLISILFFHTFLQSFVLHDKTVCKTDRTPQSKLRKR